MTVEEAKVKILAQARAAGGKYTLPKIGFGDDKQMLTTALEALITEGTFIRAAKGQVVDAILRPEIS